MGNSVQLSESLLCRWARGWQSGGRALSRKGQTGQLRAIRLSLLQLLSAAEAIPSQAVLALEISCSDLPAADLGCVLKYSSVQAQPAEQPAGTESATAAVPEAASDRIDGSTDGWQAEGRTENTQTDAEPTLQAPELSASTDDGVQALCVPEAEPHAAFETPAEDPTAKSAASGVEAQPASAAAAEAEHVQAELLPAVQLVSTPHEILPGIPEDQPGEASLPQDSMHAQHQQAVSVSQAEPSESGSASAEQADLQESAGAPAKAEPAPHAELFQLDHGILHEQSRQHAAELIAPTENGHAQPPGHTPAHGDGDDSGSEHAQSFADASQHASRASLAESSASTSEKLQGTDVSSVLPSENGAHLECSGFWLCSCRPT